MSVNKRVSFSNETQIITLIVTYTLMIMFKIGNEVYKTPHDMLTNVPHSVLFFLQVSYDIFCLSFYILS